MMQELPPQVSEQRNIAQRAMSGLARLVMLGAGVIRGRMDEHGAAEVNAYSEPEQLEGDLEARAFLNEPTDGTLHQAVLSRLEALHTTGLLPPIDLEGELRMLKDAYERQSFTQLLALNNGAYEHRLRAALHRGQALHSMYDMDRHAFQVSDYDEKRRQWMQQAIADSTGMPVREAADYAASVSTFTTFRDANGELQVATTVLGRLLDTFDRFGVERIRALSAFTGIYGLESYTTEQLERMERLYLNPKEEVAPLTQHDVTAVFVNRFGDHNGTFHSQASLYDDNHERTVFFEVRQPSDIFRHMLALHRLGIAPSTLVVGWHGWPGEFSIVNQSSGRERQAKFTVADRVATTQLNEAVDPADNEYFQSLHGMTGFARLIETCMQPSRGIDDPRGDKGRIKIIMDSCDAATPGKASGSEKTVVDATNESIIDRVASDLASSGVKTNVDIYGPADGVQTRRTDRGVAFTVFREGSRTSIGAERARLENGKITKQRVAEISLRQ